MRQTNYFLMFISAILFACSASQETTQQQKKDPEVYLFDDVTKKDTTKVETPKQQLPKNVDSSKVENKVNVKNEPVTSVKKFYVQVGVFSSQDRAQSFVQENQAKIDYVMSITLRDSDKRFVVRLQPFATHEEAEKVKNNIWQIPSFKDAFVITLE
ncbi:MAG: SPOR domain-containing protein [Ignavibacteriales bacterium]|nr:SPOR domain-containing protein [Ignavibacteriales bacterium]